MTTDTGGMDKAALADVAGERIRQHEKWGVQRHDFPVWLTVLMEEVGELAQATLLMRGVDEKYAYARREKLREMRDEAVQVAAVAVAMIEHIDEVLGDA